MGPDAVPSWLGWALLSAAFAALTAIFAKIGVSDIDSDLAARFRNAIQAAAAWANQEENDHTSGDILAKYSRLNRALIAKVTRTRFATRLTPALAQPWIDVYAEFGVIPASYSASDLVK